MKKRIWAVLRIICLFGCAGAVFYPWLSNYLYERKQSRIITEYCSEIEAYSEEQFREEREACRQYNNEIKNRQVYGVSVSSKEEAAGSYSSLLNCGADGVMAYLEIPAINLYLPIYHFDSEEVLEKGIGHIPQTSLPTGGEGCHAVLTGHSGMPGRKLFTDLPELKQGDCFCVHVLGETLYYQIDQIVTVLPDEVDSLLVEDGKDYVTLVTCTPFGINSHRLLVRGVRVQEETVLACQEDNTAQNTPAKKGSVWFRNYLKSVAAGSILLILVTISGMFVSRYASDRSLRRIKRRRRKRRRRQKNSRKMQRSVLQSPE